MTASMVVTIALVACRAAAAAPAQPTVLSSSPAPELGLVVSQALRVEDVVAGGAAATAGIRPGDILLALDGQQLVHPAAWRQAVLKHHPGAPLQLTVRRRSDEHTILPDFFGAERRWTRKAAGVNLWEQ